MLNLGTFYIVFLPVVDWFHANFRKMQENVTELKILILLSIQAERNVRFEVLTAVGIFWDIMLCSLVKVTRSFTGTCCPHLQGCKAASKLCLLPASCWILAFVLLLSPEDGSDMFFQIIS